MMTVFRIHRLYLCRSKLKDCAKVVEPGILVLPIAHLKVRTVPQEHIPKPALILIK